MDKSHYNVSSCDPEAEKQEHHMLPLFFTTYRDENWPFRSTFVEYIHSGLIDDEEDDMTYKLRPMFEHVAVVMPPGYFKCP